MPEFLALFLEVHFWSIKRVYFFKNSNVLNSLLIPSMLSTVSKKGLLIVFENFLFHFTVSLSLSPKEHFPDVSKDVFDKKRSDDLTRHQMTRMSRKYRCLVLVRGHHLASQNLTGVQRTSHSPTSFIFSQTTWNLGT